MRLLDGDPTIVTNAGNFTRCKEYHLSLGVDRDTTRNFASRGAVTFVTSVRWTDERHSSAMQDADVALTDGEIGNCNLDSSFRPYGADLTVLGEWSLALIGNASGQDAGGRAGELIRGILTLPAQNVSLSKLL